jgi:putative FmdB family regulatory protein
MPNYQFYCKLCDDTIDLFFNITEDSTTVMCEGCGNRRIKQYGVGAISFKGAGWAHKE